jgi:hypothetical protein
MFCPSEEITGKKRTTRWETGNSQEEIGSCTHDVDMKYRDIYLMLRTTRKYTGWKVK